MNLGLALQLEVLLELLVIQVHYHELGTHRCWSYITFILSHCSVAAFFSFHYIHRARVRQKAPEGDSASASGAKAAV